MLRENKGTRTTLKSQASWCWAFIWAFAPFSWRPASNPVLTGSQMTCVLLTCWDKGLNLSSNQYGLKVNTEYSRRSARGCILIPKLMCGFLRITQTSKGVKNKRCCDIYGLRHIISATSLIIYYVKDLQSDYFVPIIPLTGHLLKIFFIFNFFFKTTE